MLFRLYEIALLNVDMQVSLPVLPETIGTSCMAATPRMVLDAPNCSGTAAREPRTLAEVNTKKTNRNQERIIENMGYQINQKMCLKHKKQHK